MVVVVGPRWTVSRLHEEGDWVHRELVGARQAGALVIPLLVEGASLPTDELPLALSWLPSCQMFAINAQHWRREMGRLAERIEDALTND